MLARRAASRLSVQAPWRQALWQERDKASVYIQWFKAGIPRNRTCLCLRHGSTMTRFVRSQPFKLPEGYLQVVASATCRMRLWLHLGFVSGPGHCCRSEEDALRVEEGGRRTQGGRSRNRRGKGREEWKGRKGANSRDFGATRLNARRAASSLRPCMAFSYRMNIAQYLPLSGLVHTPMRARPAMTLASKSPNHPSSHSSHGVKLEMLQRSLYRSTGCFSQEGSED